MIVVGDTEMIEDKHSDTVGRFMFPITSCLDYEAISIFYNITGAVPYRIEEHPDFAIHTVRLRCLPSLIPMGLTTAPFYTVYFETDSFEDGITRLVIRNDGRRCVVRFERDSDSDWLVYVTDKPRLRFGTN